MNEGISEEDICRTIFESCDLSHNGWVPVATLIEEIYDAVSSPDVSSVTYSEIVVHNFYYLCPEKFI